MMKAGHSSGRGSNENVSVLCSLKTDNSTVLQELFNIYHHLQKLKCRQKKRQQEKSSDSAQSCHVTNYPWELCNVSITQQPQARGHGSWQRPVGNLYSQIKSS